MECRNETSPGHHSLTTKHLPSKDQPGPSCWNAMSWFRWMQPTQLSCTSACCWRWHVPIQSDICAYRYRCLHTRLHRTSHSWFSPTLLPSICHGVRQRRRSLLNPTSDWHCECSSSLRWSTESLPHLSRGSASMRFCSNSFRSWRQTTTMNHRSWHMARHLAPSRPAAKLSLAFPTRKWRRHSPLAERCCALCPAIQCEFVRMASGFASVSAHWCPTGCHRERLSASTWWTCEAGTAIHHSMCSLRHEVMPMSGRILPLDPTKCPPVMVFACSAASAELDWGFAAWRAVELASNWVDGSIVAVDRSAFAKPEAVTSSRAVDIDFRCAADSVDSSATDSVRKQKKKNESMDSIKADDDDVCFTPSLTIRSDKFGFSACDGDAASMLLSLISGEFERLKLLRNPPLSNDDRLTDESLLLNQTEHAKTRDIDKHYIIRLFTKLPELSHSPSNLLERMKCFWWSGSARCRRRHDGIESQALLGREIISLWNRDEIKANAQRQRENFNSLGKF